MLCEVVQSAAHDCALSRSLLKKHWTCSGRAGDACELGRPGIAGNPTESPSESLHAWSCLGACGRKEFTLCLACVLHDQAVSMPASMDIPALHKHALTRTACPYPEGFFQCDVGNTDKACECGRPCGEKQRGHAYHCSECKYDVCVSCAVLAAGKAAWPLSLHGAISKHCSAEALEALLSARAEAAREKDKQGRLALHLACEKDAVPDVVAALLAANPEAAWEKDLKGQFPLHTAALRSQSIQVTAALLEAYPR